MIDPVAFSRHDRGSETGSKLIQITFEEVIAHLDEMAAPAGVA